MRSIMPPAQPGPYPDRQLHCQMLMEERFRAVLDDAVAAGWALDEAATAMVELADNQVLMIMANTDTDDEIARAVKGR
jgi:CDP-diacylglycerol pyrophosphatase